MRRAHDGLMEVQHDLYRKNAFDDRRRRRHRAGDGRYVEPGEVAALVCFLASDDARMITGSTYAIDGGIMLGRQGKRASAQVVP